MDPWVLIVLLGACALTAGLLATRKGGRPEEGGRSVMQMQTALEQFMENMEAENREMMETALRTAKQQREENAAQGERIAALERRCAELEQRAARSDTRLESLSRETQAAAADAAARQAMRSAADAGAPAPPPALPAPAAETAPDPSAIRSRYPEIFALHDAGRSVDLIAKKAGMNKGEVMLILQLAKQEEAGRV